MEVRAVVVGVQAQASSTAYQLQCSEYRACENDNVQFVEVLVLDDFKSKALVAYMTFAVLSEPSLPRPTALRIALKSQQVASLFIRRCSFCIHRREADSHLPKDQAHAR